MCRSNGNELLGKFGCDWSVCVIVSAKRKCTKWWKWVTKNQKKKKSERALSFASARVELGFDWLGLDFHLMWERKSCSSVFLLFKRDATLLIDRNENRSIKSISIWKPWARRISSASNDISCRPFLPSLATWHSVHRFAHMNFSLNFLIVFLGSVVQFLPQQWIVWPVLHLLLCWLNLLFGRIELLSRSLGHFKNIRNLCAYIIHCKYISVASVVRSLIPRWYWVEKNHLDRHSSAARLINLTAAQHSLTRFSSHRIRSG